MEPYYEGSNVTIYNAPWEQVFPALGAVDVVITDPPYSDRTHKNAMTNKRDDAPEGYRQGGSKLINFDSWSDGEFAAFAMNCLRLASRWVVMTCDHRHAALTFDWTEHIRLGAWCKGAPMPQITGDRPGSGHESILILHNEGKKRWNGGGKSAIYHANVLKDANRVYIPTQKPDKLLVELISDFSEEGETILDPCMGSGTTLVNAVRLGRKAIGIESNPSRCAIAVERLSQGALFAWA